MNNTVRIVSAAPAAKEHQENLPGHVERRQKCGKRPQPPRPRVAVIGHQQDLVLAEKARRQRKTRQRQRADDITSKRDRHDLAETAHSPHVLFVVRADDDAAGTQE